MIIQYRDLETYKTFSQRVGFCSGSFDLTHYGHILFLQECKSYVDYLYVMVGTDREIRNLKGSTRPILNEQTRLHTIDSLRCVDICFLPSNAFSKPLDCVYEAISILRPTYYFVTEDSFDLQSRIDALKGCTTQIMVLKRNPPEFDPYISTTNIIHRILEDE